MNYPVTPKPPNTGNPAISILRVVLWLIPAVFLFVGILFAIGLDEKWPILLIPGFGATAGLGYYDRRLHYQQMKKDPATERKELIRWVVIFVLLQIMIAPAVVFTVVYGICLTADFGLN